MDTMIALIGGQTLPNFLPVLHYQPSSVVLFYTTTTKQQYEYLKATLEKSVEVHGLEVDPFNILEIVKSMNNCIDELVKSSSQSLTFNITGGTKPMSLAAYQVAFHREAPIMYLQSEGKQTRVYHYTWEDQQLKADKIEFLPESIKLQEIFDLHLGPGNWEEQGASNGEGGPLEDAIANTLRNNGYEVMVGVKTMNNNIDIDVAVRFDNQYGIIEAKTGDSGRKLDGIKQLSTISRLLGTYSQPLLVITVSQEPTQKMVVDASNIQVISLLTYERGSHILSQEEATKLLDRVGTMLKG